MTEQRRVLEPGAMTWSAGGELPGVRRALLSTTDGGFRWETAMVALGAETALPVAPAGQGVEIYVVEGTWNGPEGLFVQGTFFRSATFTDAGCTTDSGCLLLVRTRRFRADDRDTTSVDSSSMNWLPGQGGLTVKPLHAVDTESTALVHWPAGERFVLHRHYGGEEILVLSGAFCDEHGRHPRGTWIQSPHLSTHHPFVEEETVILVKTGHLPPATAP